MTFPPDLKVNQNADVILARMKSNEAMTGIDTSVNSPMNMALAPVSIELAESYRQLESMLWRNRLVGPPGEVATGSDLDAVGAERGIYRLPGAYAIGIVRFLGPQGTAIGANTVVTTLGPNVRRFRTDHATVIPVSEEIDVAATALVVGTSSNVPTGAIQLLEVPISRTRVTNLDPFTGGVNVEDDDQYRARIVEFVRDPPNGSNPAQYRKWARDVPGIGGAITLRPGEPDAGPPGTVDLYVVDLLMQPAGPLLVDAVQEYIAPGREVLVQDTDLSVQVSNGVTTGVTARPGALGTVTQMAYHAANDGELRLSGGGISSVMIQGGNWQARVRAQVSSTAGATDLLRFEVYNSTQGVIAKGTVDQADGTAWAVYRANQMSLEWAYYVVRYYWNGTDTLYLRIIRQRSDGSTVVFIDSIEFHSNFSSFDREGLAPILDEVRVRPAVGRPIDVAASIHIEPAYTWGGAGGVQASVALALNLYLRDVALANATDPTAVANDIIYGEVGAAIQDTPGVDYYDPATLRVNGATSNVSVAKREVAVPGVYALTQI